MLDTAKTTLAWFDYSLKGMHNEFASDAPVRIFVMGDNAWRDEKEFPLARMQYTKYYLHGVKGANAIKGDGALNMTTPGAEKADSFYLRSSQSGAHNRGPSLLRSGASTRPCKPTAQ